MRKNVFRLQCRLWKAVRANDKKRINRLQRLLLKSRSARFLAIRQITQLNQGKKTPGIDGKAKLNFQERFELEQLLKTEAHNWKHQGLREIPIPKKDGTTRMLKVPTIQDRAWQKLVHYALDAAHEATFHTNSYGFRPGRSAHDAQKAIFDNLRSYANGKNKFILEMDIAKCFDRIRHDLLMKAIMLPQAYKQGVYICLKAGQEVGFDEGIGTPQGGIISPTLANIALNELDHSRVFENKGLRLIRYADDMVLILKPQHIILKDSYKNHIESMLKKWGLELKEAKTKFVSPTDGFDFLGWHFYVQANNGKFRCVPSKDNYRSFVKKVKTIVNCSNYGAETKASKLAPIIRGWRKYHRFCDMEKYNLFSTEKRTWKVFRKEKNSNRCQVDAIIKKAFPDVSYSENAHIKVQGNRSPYDGDLIYWSQRNSKLYDGKTAELLRKQNHTCGYCGIKFIYEEKVHLHHTDGNHDNWKSKNLLVVHESCHDYIHMNKVNNPTIPLK